jgi:dolichol-phosphate mannosyltransferase
MQQLSTANGTPAAPLGADRPAAPTSRVGPTAPDLDPAHARLLISLATYNERENLPTLVRRIKAIKPAADILVIDDNSPDGTGALADELAVADRSIQVLHRPGKLGLGTAYLAAIRYAVADGYDYLLTMDADLSHSPDHLPELVAGMAGADVMIGSRYVRGGGTRNWPLKRRLMSRGLNAVFRRLLRIPARDISGGFRCYRVNLLRQLPLDQLQSDSYAFLEELLFRCRQAGCRIGEVPIVFENRRAGASKLNLREMVRSLWLLFGLAARATVGLERKRPAERGA